MKIKTNSYELEQLKVLKSKLEKIEIEDIYKQIFGDDYVPEEKDEPFYPFEHKIEQPKKDVCSIFEKECDETIKRIEIPIFDEITDKDLQEEMKKRKERSKKQEEEFNPFEDEVVKVKKI